mgnify:CR=1 FL=1
MGNLVKKPTQVKPEKPEEYSGYIGDYGLVKTLGKGAFCKVKLGFNTKEGSKPVAVKIMKDGDNEAIEQMRQELEIMKALKHENIINVVNYGCEPSKTNSKPENEPTNKNFTVLELC